MPVAHFLRRAALARDFSIRRFGSLPFDPPPQELIRLREFRRGSAPLRRRFFIPRRGILSFYLLYLSIWAFPGVTWRYIA